jgi:Cu-processing system ATP-binding protein
VNAAERLIVNAIELQGVCKRYGDQQVITELDLSIAAGESLAIIGHNGAGKTTLMKLILGLARPSAGQVKVWNQPAGKRASRQQHLIGFLPESVAFHGGISGREMLRFYARLKGEPLSQCDELLELLGLGEAASRPIRSYSKGMRQRLGLAQALLGKPRLLLLDEPTSGLDPFLRQHFYDIIAERQAAGTTILLSSHALTEIEAQTGRIAIMSQGRIVIAGTLQQLRVAAELPDQLVVTSKPGSRDQLLKVLLKEGREISPLAADSFELYCSRVDKVALLQRISAESQLIEDIEVNPPRLDDLYAHFIHRHNNSEHDHQRSRPL